MDWQSLDTLPVLSFVGRKKEKETASLSRPWLALVGTKACTPAVLSQDFTALHRNEIQAKGSNPSEAFFFAASSKTSPQDTKKQLCLVVRANAVATSNLLKTYTEVFLFRNLCLPSHEYACIYPKWLHFVHIISTRHSFHVFLDWLFLRFLTLKKEVWCLSAVKYSLWEIGVLKSLGFQKT